MRLKKKKMNCSKYSKKEVLKSTHYGKYNNNYSKNTPCLPSESKEINLKVPTQKKHCIKHTQEGILQISHCNKYNNHHRKYEPYEITFIS